MKNKEMYLCEGSLESVLTSLSSAHFLIPSSHVMSSHVISPEASLNPIAMRPVWKSVSDSTWLFVESKMRKS